MSTSKKVKVSLAVATLMGGVVVMWKFYFLIADIPRWVMQTGWPEWILRDWPLSLPFAFILYALLALRLGWFDMVEEKPAPVAVYYPEHRELPTRDFWRWVDMGLIKQLPAAKR